MEPLQARGVCRQGRQARLFLKPGSERHTRVSRQVLPRPRHVVETLLRANGTHGSSRTQVTVPRQDGELEELIIYRWVTGPSLDRRFRLRVYYWGKLTLY